MRSVEFQKLHPSRQAEILLSRKGVGHLVGATSGFSGSILKFSHRADRLPEICVKIPANKYGRRETGERFLREIKIQRSFYFHQYVHWPADFDFVMNVPIAWFRFWHTDLAQIITDQHFNLTERLSMLAYLASAMRHCHSRGLIAHQDFKPENIFVRDLRRDNSGLPNENIWKIPKLADFGSVNLANEKGVFAGTRPYMAPEQWREEPLGEHTTVWSLGLIFYELMSHGHHPIGDSTARWRRREAGIWNKWQKNHTWRQWVDRNCPLNASLSNRSYAEFVSACINPAVSVRPTLLAFQSKMIEFVGALSENAAKQVRFQIFHWDLNGAGGYDWPYLDYKLQWLEEQVKGLED